MHVDNPQHTRRVHILKYMCMQLTTGLKKKNVKWRGTTNGSTTLPSMMMRDATAKNNNKGVNCNREAVPLQSASQNVGETRLNIGLAACQCPHDTRISASYNNNVPQTQR